MKHENLLYELRSDPRFMDFVADVMKQRPVIPSYDARLDNTEIWKFESAKQQGFDVWLVFLKITPTLEIKHGKRKYSAERKAG